MRRVAIVIPNHNKGTLVEQTLDSVLAQTIPVEVVIVDDASTDESRDIVRRYGEHHPNIRTILLDANRGGSHCRNLGLATSTADHVVFLDSDDLLEPTSCENRLAAAAAHPAHDAWVFPMRVFRDDPTQPIATWTPTCDGDPLGAFLRHRMPWSIMQPLWRRPFLVGIGGFDESFERLQDPEMHARALMAGARVKCFPQAAPDCSYRVAETRTKSDPVAAARRHTDAAIYFYRTFADKVGSRLPQLSGTLEAALARIIAEWRRGRISSADLAEMGGNIVAACRLQRHRIILAAYLRCASILPIHPPGIGTVVRSLLR